MEEFSKILCFYLKTRFLSREKEKGELIAIFLHENNSSVSDGFFCRSATVVVRGQLVSDSSDGSDCMMVRMQLGG